jgi:hypothetical protein
MSAARPLEQLPSLESIFGPVISAYSRAQAIEDGVLVDVSSVAREAGIKFPVAMTRAAFEQTVTVPPGVVGQDESGRLWDVLWMLRCAIQRGRGGERVDFELYVRSASSHERLTRRDLVQLYALCGPGDAGEPVITIMQPGED